MKPSILLIDDDHGPMDYYVEALKGRGFTVSQIDSVDDAFRWIEAPETQEPDVIAIDLMMPPGTRLTLEATNGGLCSGLFVLDAIRKRFPHARIIVLTNLNNPDINATLPPDVPRKAKFETGPVAFADFVRETLAKTSPSS